MQSYQTNIVLNNNFRDNVSYILNNLNKKSYIQTLKIQSDAIHMIIEINKKKYSLNIYIDNKKASYIFINIDNPIGFENDLCNKLYDINFQIDNYERLEDIIFEVINIINECGNNAILKNTEIKKIESKNLIDFIKDVEKEKKLVKTKSIISKILSVESVIEMLGDQLIKLHSNPNFSVELDSLQKFSVSMRNFNIKIKDDNDCKDYQDLNVKVLISLSDDIISSPPTISIKSNYIFKNNILNVIEKLKPFNDKSIWSIKYSIYDTIENIYQMISKYGELDSNSKSELEGILIELEYLLSIKSENISENKLLLEFDEVLANELSGFVDTKNKSTFWKAGTGYGHSGSFTWNIDDYAKAIKIKKSKVIEKLNVVFELLNKLCKLELYEINKLKIVFKHYMMDDELDTSIVSNIASVIVNYNSHFNDKDFITQTVKSIKEYLEDNNISHPINKVIENVKITDITTDEFQKIFNDYKFKYYDGTFNSFHYQNIKELTSSQVSRVQKEFQILKKSITIHRDASIFFCIQKNNVNKIRFMISGPKNTPYEYGLFIFDMTMPETFPSGPPLVNFSNNGGKRFNPNLYDSGKVCLSLLGTWRGDKGESWNINTSTFNQLLISIQSQILIDEPYFNEPGYEKTIGTEQGKTMSKEYNYNIRQYTLDHTINDLLSNNKYPEFKDIIKNYFKFQKHNIIKTLNTWHIEMPASKSIKFAESLNKFMELVNKV